MKEATGELNMTVITVVAIAAVAAFFYAFVWPAIKNNINRNQLCAQAFGCVCTESDKTCTCSYCDSGDNNCAADQLKTVSCPNQNYKEAGE